MPLDRYPMNDAPPVPSAGASGAAPFVFEEFFLGKVSGRGIVQDRRGRLRQSFLVDMHGYWRGPDFVLDELFRIDDGTLQRRSWVVTRNGAGRYWAVADDLVGHADGTAMPGLVRWRYRLRVPVGRRRIVLSFDDRMYRMADGTVLDVSDMRKFGIRVGRIVLALARHE
jgi:hypothetical protein